MIITPLGHTEFLIDIANKDGENVRILVDSWMSDYALGDMMERTVKVSLDREKLSTIDALYISHAHSDHFDPYTLMEIYRHAQPIVFLPFTLRYLGTLIEEYIPSIEIHFLDNHTPFFYRGVEITGHMYQNPEITNEDDVMMLEVANDHEMLLAEIDTIPDMYDESVAKSLHRVFTRKSYETACYIASRNMLEGQIPLYETPPAKRRALRDNYIAEQKESMKMEYEKYDYEEYAHFPNLFLVPGFVRGFIGQGIRYPSVLSAELADMQIWPLDEIVSTEQDYAKNASYEFSQKALLAGRQYILQSGTIETGRKDCPLGVLEKPELIQRDFLSIPARLYATGPLFPGELSVVDIEEGKKQILEILNTRFLPYWSASGVVSLRDALIKNNGIYRVGFRLSHDTGVIIFEYSTARIGFIETQYEENLKIDEDYYLCDILDYLEGRQEMYSSFWHRLDPKKIYRLWTCLGATFMNHDLVLAKYRLHFERAKIGETVNTFVEGVLKNIT